MSDKKISVLIPVFNREEYIEEAVNSIREQLYSNLDILIYNDGSTDNTLNIIKDLASKDKRIKIYGDKVNRGGVYAKYQLIKKSQTKIICYQDSDDISHPKRIAKQVKAIQEGNHLVYCDWLWIEDYNGKRHFKKPETLCAGSIMYRKDESILPNPKFKLSGGDLDYIKRYLKKHQKSTVLNDILYYVRSHSDRIGVWKRKFKKLPKDIRKNKSYKELIEYYKKYYEK